MAAFVREDPDSGADAALQKTVSGPGEDAEGLRGKKSVDVQGEVEEDGGVEEIAEDVGRGNEERAVETVLGNSIFDCRQSYFFFFLPSMSGFVSSAEAHQVQ
jgi:hypothetical protein